MVFSNSISLEIKKIVFQNRFWPKSGMAKTGLSTHGPEQCRHVRWGRCTGCGNAGRCGTYNLWGGVDRVHPFGIQLNGNTDLQRVFDYRIRWAKYGIVHVFYYSCTHIEYSKFAVAAIERTNLESCRLVLKSHLGDELAHCLYVVV